MSSTKIKTTINAACLRRGVTTAYQLAKVTGLSQSASDRAFNDKLSKLDLVSLSSIVAGLSTQPERKPKPCKLAELIKIE